jgi:hypothetical protein
MFITNNPETAKAAHAGGVTRLFVDWEIHNKYQRQGHLDTVINRHSYEDALRVRNAVPEAELLIRLNPYHENTDDEVEQALSAGADLIMLPMFYRLEEIVALNDMVKGRAGIVPLVETAESLNLVESIAQVSGVYELFVGLNDLHRALNMKFMFEPVADGAIERVANAAKKNNIRYGFGGIARIDEGLVSGEMVLAEHARLGSSSVILSRTFYRDDAPGKCDSEKAFTIELQKLKNAEYRMLKRNSTQIKQDMIKFQLAVKNIAGRNLTHD